MEEKNKFVGKDYDTVLNDALSSMNVTLDDVVVFSRERKLGLFKGTQIEVTVTPLSDIVEFVKNYLEEVLSAMGVEVSFETQIRERQIKVKMFSNDNPLLIGQGGKNLAALQTVVRAVAKNKYGKSPYISLDVENYKDRQLQYLEKTAKRIAKEVSETKVPVELDSMNSYERLIVHNAIADFKGITTISVGEEPNRHVVIKPEDK